MKVTFQLPEPVGQELLGLPNPDAFVSRAVVRALEENRARGRQVPQVPAGRRKGRRLEPSEEREPRLPEVKSRDHELAWRHSHRDELQRRFAGEWVVLEGEEVVAHSGDAAQAMEQARAKGIAVPFVFYVDSPRPDVVYIGL